MAAAGITVAVEKAAHDAMRELAQAIWDKHGVCVRGVRFSWVDVSGMGDTRLLVTDVELETLMKAGSRPGPVIPQPGGHGRKA